MAKTPTKIKQKPKQKAIIAFKPETTQEKISEEKKPKESTKVSNIISIVSLVLVLLNIMITTAFGLYQQTVSQKFQVEQQTQQQKFQEELQKQAIDLQQQSEIANIAITSSTEEILNNGSSLTPIHGAISVINNGPAIAKNLRIEVCMKSAEWPWREEITDIKNFSINTSKASISSDKIVNKDCQSDFDARGIYDTVILNIISLAPNQKVTVRMELDPQQIEYKTIKSNKIVSVNITKSYVPQGNDASSYFSKNLTQFLNNKFPLVTFASSAFCDNCALDNNNNDYLSTTITSLSSHEISKKQTIFEDDGLLSLSYNLLINEIIPKNYNYTNKISSPLYLLITQDIVEIDKNTFEQPQVYFKECADGIDNDGDGFTDWPADPNCSNKNDNSESR